MMLLAKCSFLGGLALGGSTLAEVTHTDPSGVQVLDLEEGDTPSESSEVEAILCFKQNRGAWKTCSATSQCGTAECMPVKGRWNNGGTTVEVPEGDYCACGIEAFVGGDDTAVESCSCKAISSGSCDMMWRDSIMCPFACEDCKACNTKTTSECENDGLCQLTDGKCKDKTGECSAKGSASSDACKLLMHGEMRMCRWNETHCNAANLKNADDVSKCEPLQKEQCDTTKECMTENSNEGPYKNDAGEPAWTSGDKNWETECTDTIKTECKVGPYLTNFHEQGCNDLSYIERQGDMKCPSGYLMFYDKYMDSEHHMFAVCVRNNRVVPNCKFYTWDGEECEECMPKYRLGDVLEPTGMAEVHLNGICVLDAYWNEVHKDETGLQLTEDEQKQAEINDYCYVFEKPLSETERAALQNYQHPDQPITAFSPCARCGCTHRCTGDQKPGDGSRCTLKGGCTPAEMEEKYEFVWSDEDTSTKSLGECGVAHEEWSTMVPTGVKGVVGAAGIFAAWTGLYFIKKTLFKGVPEDISHDVDASTDQ